MRSRRAQFEHTLVYYDEPHVITLRARATRFIAIAVPTDEDSALFFAVTVSQSDWQKYISGHVDLRYLFVFPTSRIRYTFDLNKIDEDHKVTLVPFERMKDTPEEYLPSPRFFSENHTEEIEEVIFSNFKEVLNIDGEWELTEFGAFQQKYSDVYAFLTSSADYADENASAERKDEIWKAFKGLPFQGGGSYVSLYKELNDNVPRIDRLKLDKIKYASPGTVEIFGRKAIFDELQHLVETYLMHRGDVLKSYKELYDFLSRNKYLKLASYKFDKDDPSGVYILNKARELSDKLGFSRFSALQKLCSGNELVIAKVVLSLYRRVEQASTFFAQGRVEYPE